MFQISMDNLEVRRLLSGSSGNLIVDVTDTPEVTIFGTWHVTIGGSSGVTELDDAGRDKGQKSVTFDTPLQPRHRHVERSDVPPSRGSIGVTAVIDNVIYFVGGPLTRTNYRGTFATS